MTDNGQADPPSDIIWGRDIERPNAVHPPPDVVPYLQGLANGLNGFAAQRRRSIEYYIQVFELDREAFLARRGNRDELDWELALQQTLDNRDRQPGDQEYVKPYNINKALALELMMTCALYRLLSPTCVRSNCKLKYGWPVNFAPARKPDITVDVEGFVFHVEVSAKIDMDDEYFGDELTGTLNHMIIADVAWALLVTAWDYKTARTSKVYKEFKSGRQADLAHHRLLIMSLQEMAELSATLAFDEDFNSGKKRLNPALVHTLFEALHAAQESREEKDGADKKKKKTRKAKTKGKQKQATKKKEVISLRDTWVNTTKGLLMDRPVPEPDPDSEPDSEPDNQSEPDNVFGYDPRVPLP